MNSHRHSHGYKHQYAYYFIAIVWIFIYNFHIKRYLNTFSVHFFSADWRRLWNFIFLIIKQLIIQFIHFFSFLERKKFTCILYENFEIFFKTIFFSFACACALLEFVGDFTSFIGVFYENFYTFV